MREKDYIFYFGEGEKAEWWDRGKIQGYLGLFVLCNLSW